MKAGIGMLLVALGVSTADSECLIIPTVLVFAGAILLMMYQKEFDDEE